MMITFHVVGIQIHLKPSKRSNQNSRMLYRSYASDCYRT